MVSLEQGLFDVTNKKTGIAGAQVSAYGYTFASKSVELISMNRYISLLPSENNNSKCGKVNYNPS